MTYFHIHLLTSDMNQLDKYRDMDIALSITVDKYVFETL